MSAPILTEARTRVQALIAKRPIIASFVTRFRGTSEAPEVPGHTTPRAKLTPPSLVIKPIMGTIYASIFNPTTYPPIPPIKGTIYT